MIIKETRSLPDRIPPGPGQESVWDYPRPPRVELTSQRIQVYFNGVKLVDSTRALRVLETAHPPVYYIPPQDVLMLYLKPVGRTTYCEWKGMARYYAIQAGTREASQAAWSYPQPFPAYQSIKDYLAFFAGSMDSCLVDGERVVPQPGGYYGGWITANITGPFKGGPGSQGW